MGLLVPEWGLPTPSKEIGSLKVRVCWRAATLEFGGALRYIEMYREPLKIRAAGAQKVQVRGGSVQYAIDGQIDLQMVLPWGDVRVAFAGELVSDVIDSAGQRVRAIRFTTVPVRTAA